MMNTQNKQKGFTLIELMIVVAIIGILAAIAIPQFSTYRVKAFNSTAQADLRNLMTSEEAVYIDAQQYVNLTKVVGPSNALTSLPGAKLSKNVSAQVTLASKTDFTAEASHGSGDLTYKGQASASITESSGVL